MKENQPYFVQLLMGAMLLIISLGVNYLAGFDVALLTTIWMIYTLKTKIPF